MPVLTGGEARRSTLCNEPHNRKFGGGYTFPVQNGSTPAVEFRQVNKSFGRNKVLKDIVVKSRTMLGHDAVYVPGWDCHGLPIEHQVDKELGPRAQAVGTAEKRLLCRAYAEKYIDIQRQEFKRLGVLGDWENPYTTMSPDYEATIVRELGRFVGAGSLYKGLKPVHWCSTCVTALAEAEVEYEDHVSPSIYVKFPVKDPKGKFAVDQRRGTHFVIWTTTPWTLPANLAIALHPRLMYSLVQTPAGALILAWWNGRLSFKELNAMIESAALTNALVFFIFFGATLFAFVFLVALGIDYNIFLMTRVREETAHHGTRRGSLIALSSTGGVITSAGFVLAATFAMLATMPMTFALQIGTTIALGVLLTGLAVSIYGEADGRPPLPLQAHAGFDYVIAAITIALGIVVGFVAGLVGEHPFAVGPMHEHAVLVRVGPEAPDRAGFLPLLPGLAVEPPRVVERRHELVAVPAAALGEFLGAGELQTNHLQRHGRGSFSVSSSRRRRRPAPADAAR